MAVGGGCGVEGVSAAAAQARIQREASMVQNEKALEKHMREEEKAYEVRGHFARLARGGDVGRSGRLGAMLAGDRSGGVCACVSISTGNATCCEPSGA